VEKGRWRISKGFRMNPYFVFMGGFGKKVDLKGVDMILLMHLKGVTVQYPFNIFCVVHVMMPIDITVSDHVGLSHFRLNRGRKLFRLFVGYKIIEHV
jgi:hypothetical protein